MNTWKREFVAAFLEFRQSSRPWHIPILACLCVGVPILTGYFLGDVKSGVLASTSGLVILYFPAAPFAHRMTTLIACSFGFILSFFVGFSFSFNPWLSAMVLGIYVFGVHWFTSYIKLKPPGNFFFIMIAAIASCLPFDASLIPEKVGLVAMGAIGACGLALIYSLMSLNKSVPKREVFVVSKNKYVHLTESLVWGTFLALSLGLAHLLELENPYWVPTSCAAVMQGINLQHVWRRSFHRVLGTFLGLGLAWMLLSFRPSVLVICFLIMLLQFIVEVLVVRNYTIAAIFITALTLFLAESSNPVVMDHPNQLIYIRMLDIVLGSAIGAAGGWFLYHQKLKTSVERQIRKTYIVLRKRRPSF